MPNPKENHTSDAGSVRLDSDCDILEITEDMSKPGKISERYRKSLEQRYGHKISPPKESTDKPEES